MQTPEENTLQQQAVAAFLPSLPASPTLFAAISEQLLGSSSLAAVITPESLKRRLGSPREDEGPQAGAPTRALEEEEIPKAPQQKGRQGWAPLDDQELLKRVATLQAACPSLCVIASLFPLISLFGQLAHRRRLPKPPSPVLSTGAAPSAAEGGPCRLLLIPLYRSHEDLEGDVPLEWEGGPPANGGCNLVAASPAAVAAGARAAAAAAAAGASCISGAWRQVALEVGALRVLEPTARILVVFVGTRTALTTPQPPPPEGGDDNPGDDTVEACRSPGAAAETAGTKTCDAPAGATAAGRNNITSSSSSRREKRKSRDLLSSLDALVCDLLLLWQADTAYEHNENAAAALLLRLVKTTAATRQLRLFPRGKLRRLAATANDEAATTHAIASAAVAEDATIPGSTISAVPRTPDTLKRLWQTQLLQLPGVSEEVACAVSAAFPTPSTLFARAEAEAAAAPAGAEGTPGGRGKGKGRASTARGASKLQAELADIVVPGRCGNRRLGEALARRILRVFVLETDPEAPL